MESRYIYRTSPSDIFQYGASYEYHTFTSHRKLRYSLHYVGISGMYYHGAYWFLENFFRKLRKALHIKINDKTPLLFGIGIGPYFNYLIRGREGGKPITHANLHRFNPGIAIGIRMTPPSYYYDKKLRFAPPLELKLQIGFRSVLDFRLNYLNFPIFILSSKVNF